MPDTGQVEVSLKEIALLGATDTEFFGKSFFPRAFRQPSPRFAQASWDLLDNPTKRLVLLQMFRGSSKTTRLRVFAAKRIGYAISRTILYIGKSEGHAVRSLKWLKKQIEFNARFAQTFQLRKGSKWQDIEFEVIHGVEEITIWVVGMGVTGSTRGINFDDFRPDLIIVDDILDEENASTPEQRQKMEDLLYGALMESLAPLSEAPDAKLAFLQTPLNRDDASMMALKDPAWASMVIGCWTPETMNLPIDQQESIWPERWSSETLREEKRMALARNKYSIFAREKECRVITPETSTFMPLWLKHWDQVPVGATHILVIDPVPPPTDAQVAKGFQGKDYEAIAVVAVYDGTFYVREISVNRGHDPQWTVTETFRLDAKYNPLKWIVEAVSYQKVLHWILRQAMAQFRRYRLVEEFPEKHKSKYVRIVNGLTGVASNGQLLLPPVNDPMGGQHSPGIQMFVQQFNEHPNVSHDDALEVVAIAVLALAGKIDKVLDGEIILPEDDDYRPHYLTEACP